MKKQKREKKQKPARQQAGNKKQAGKKLALQSISVKILAVVLSAIVLVAVLCVAVMTVLNNIYTDQIVTGEVTRAYSYLNTRIDKLKNNCVVGTLTLANSDLLKATVAQGDPSRISFALTGLPSAGLDFAVVMDNDGAVLFNTRKDETDTGYLAGVLTGGSGVYADSQNNLYLLSPSVVKDEHGATVGTLIGGIFFNRQDLLDELHGMLDVDFSIYSGDTAVATTIMQGDQNATGTKLDAQIAQTVLTDKQEHQTRTAIFGVPYAAIYSPVLNNAGDAIGVLFTGLDITEIEAGSTRSMMISIGAVIALIVAAVIVVLIFVRKSIRKPLAVLTSGAQRLAVGNTDFEMDIKRQDEIGMLAGAFRGAADALKAMLADADALAQAAVEGHLSTRADAEKHQGDFKKIVEGVNNTLDAVIKPVQESSAVLAEMSKGDLSVSVKGDYMGDHAIIKDALNGTISAIRGYIGEISTVLGEMARGNLNVSIESEYKGDFIALKDSINAIIASLNNVLGDIGLAADQVASGTRQVSDGSQDISQGATEQSSAIEELTASVSEIAEQTRQNAMSANEANQLTASAATDAAKGNEQMLSMQQAMSDISEASHSIGKIIKVIDDIAFQTNILALNAAVEAARAGVHGKGFAVVADEVRSLAARSAGAARETTELIEGSIKKTAAGTRIADDTAAALGEIVDGIRKAGQLVSEIAHASNEQASAIAQVNRGIEQLSAVVQNNSATAEEAAAASEELSGQAEMLKNMVRQFSLKEAGMFAEPETSALIKSKTPQPEEISIDLSDKDFGKY